VTSLLVVLRLTLAVVFAVSAFAKLADRGGFRASLASFGVPEGPRSFVALLVPILELSIVLGLLPSTSAWFAAVSAAGLLLLFTLAIVVNLVGGRRPDCHCFGQLSTGPVGWGSVARNGLLIGAAAAVVAVRGPVNAGPSMVAWVTRLSLGGQFGVAAVVMVLALMGVQARMFTHLLRQHGRLLLRLDAMETALARAGLPPGGAERPAPADPHLGLSVGAPAPAFQLERLDGGVSAMTDLLAPGRPLALAFVHPDCGPCAALLPELAQWEQALAGEVTLALITSGTVGANNRKLNGHGLRHVLVQKSREVSDAYQAHGTPSMVLVEPGGTISSPVTPGRDAIRSLMAKFTAARHQPGALPVWSGPAARNGSNRHHQDGGTVAQSRIGQPAPELRLTDLDGKQVSLASFRGHPALVLFWNPGCGFCQGMLNDLKTWETRRPDASPRLFVVSAGSVEANRVMRLRSTVLLDAGFESGRAFGASGTPSAVLVDKDGRIASEVAVGARGVLALAAEQSTAMQAGV